MKKLNQNQVKNASTYILVTAAFLILQVLSTQGKLNSTTKGFLVPACAYIVLAVSLNLLVGICGELSLGHAGFMGIGAFTGIVVTSLLAEAVPNGVLRLVMGMVAGGVLAGVVGFLIGIPVLRLRGDYLAIVTLAFGEIMKNVFGNLYLGVDENGLHATIKSEGLTLAEGGKMIISGPRGATGITKLSTFAVGFVLILLTLFVVQNLINSKEGRAIKAVRDNRIAAESIGLNVTAEQRYQDHHRDHAEDQEKNPPGKRYKKYKNNPRYFIARVASFVNKKDNAKNAKRFKHGISAVNTADSIACKKQNKRYLQKYQQRRYKHTLRYIKASAPTP